MLSFCCTNAFLFLKKSQPTTQYQEPNQTFKYTLDYPDSPFSLDDRQFYEENGYLVVEKLFSTEELDMYNQRFKDICEGKVRYKKSHFIQHTLLGLNNKKKSTTTLSIRSLLHS